MALSSEETKELILLQRNIRYNLQLETYTNIQLLKIQDSVDKAFNELSNRLIQQGKKIKSWDLERTESLLTEMDKLTVGIQNELGRDLVNLTTEVYENALEKHNDIVSFGGRVKGFNNVSLSPAQLRSFAVITPVGGRLLQKPLLDGSKSWINRIFTTALQEDIQKEIIAGALKGESYRKIVNRLQQGFDKISKQEATTLARTYVQSANVDAMQKVYSANTDIIKGVEWNATLETGYKTDGTGTCVRCAALDGQKWDTVQDMPQMPLHPNCRCVPIPITKSYKELGLNMKEIERVYRPYTIRPPKSIGAGGRRTIINDGFHKGNYASWYKKQPKISQINAVGKNRQKLIADGDIKFKDLVSRKTGDLVLLNKLSPKYNKYGRLKKKYRGKEQ